MKKHQLIVLAHFPVADILPFISEGVPRRTFGTVTYSVSNSRLRTFKDNQQCVRCGLQGILFLLERHKDQPKGYHLNLYAKRHGQLILMTQDHIRPKSKGGQATQGNLQTMCTNCNRDKGDRVDVWQTGSKSTSKPSSNRS